MKSLFSMLVLGSSLLASSAFAHELKYSCLNIGDNDVQDDVTLTVVNHKEVKVGDDRANLDVTYAPRLNTDYLRFEYVESSEGTSEVLVQDKLLKGARQGFIKIQNRGEGFGTDKLHCTLN